MKITVYLGSHEGSDPFLKEAVRELGVWIAENNHILVYGGSKIGLMGELADSVLNAEGMAIKKILHTLTVDLKFLILSLI